MSEIESRRQRARKAAYDQMPVERVASSAWDIERAIGAATQVTITPEVLANAYPDLPPMDTVLAVVRLTNTLTALGFEVVD